MSPRCLTGRIRPILVVVTLLVLTLPASLVDAHVDITRKDQLLSIALEYIEMNRKGTTELQFIDSMTGIPVGETEVHYQQISHDFVFSTS